MTKAYEKITKGLTEALAIARGEQDPARLYVPPGTDVKPTQSKIVIPRKQVSRVRRKAK